MSAGQQASSPGVYPRDTSAERLTYELVPGYVQIDYFLLLPILLVLPAFSCIFKKAQS